MASTNPPSGKTQTILGFMFDFKTNAGKALGKVRKELGKTLTQWGLDFRKLRKNVSRSLRMMSGDVKLLHAQLAAEVPSITDVISHIGDTFGGVAGIIADTLMRPGALAGAAIATMAKVGVEHEKVVVSMRRETALSNSEIEKYGKAIEGVSREMEAPLSQLQAMAKRFASANMEIDKFAALSKTAIAVSRLSGVETAEVADQIIRLTKALQMTPEGINDYYNTAHAVAKATQVDIHNVISGTERMAVMIKRFLPGMYKEGLVGASQLSGIFASLFEDAGPVVDKFFSSMIDRESAGFSQLRNLVAQSGADAVAAFDESLKRGDFLGAFQRIQVGIRKMMDSTGDAAFQLRGAFEEAFGFSPDVLMSLGQIDTNLYAQVAAMGDVAKASNSILKETKDITTTSERWWRLWSKIELIALPFGEKLIEVLEVVQKVASAILTPIEKFVAGLGDSGKLALLLGAGLLSAKAMMGPIVDLSMVLFKNLTGVSSVIYNVIGKLGEWLRLSKAAKVATTEIRDEFGVLTGAINTSTAASTSLFTVMKGMAATMLKVLWPIMAVVAVMKVLDGLMKKVFGVSTIQVFEKVLNAVGSVLEWIGTILGGIIKGVAWLFGASLDTDKPTWDLRTDKEKLEAQKSDEHASNFQPVHSNQSSLSMNYEYSARDKPLVIDDEGIRESQMEAARLIADTIKNMPTQSPQLVPGRVGMPSRHTPIPDSANFGAR